MSARPVPHPQLKEQLIRLYRYALAAGISPRLVELVADKYLAREMAAASQESVDDQVYEEKVAKTTPAAVRIFATWLPPLLLTLGVILIGNAFLPIAGYYLTTGLDNQLSKLQAPIPQAEVVESYSATVLAQSKLEPSPQVLSSTSQSTKPVILNEALDYTNLANWFSQELNFGEGGDLNSGYLLDIPKLEIYNAQVVTGGTRLDQSLIQYPGTADPGGIGAPVIFGHSVLRQFYNPDENNPRRYNSIFSYIMTLQKGDKIIITKDDITYTYQVIDKTEVQPEDTYILNQRRDSRLLKLVTCVPEGTYLRRGVITAVLVGQPQL